MANYFCNGFLVSDGPLLQRYLAIDALLFFVFYTKKKSMALRRTKSYF